MKRAFWVVGALLAIFAFWRASKVLHAKNMDWQQTRFYAEDNKRLQDNDPKRVVFFGDSITYRWGATSFFTDKPYIDRGIPEQTTSQMLLRFRQDVIDLHPKAVVILAGTNDVIGFNDPFATKTAESNIETMAELARMHGIRVILCSLLPANHRNRIRNLNFTVAEQELNSWLRNYSSSQGLTYVDYYSAMDDGTGKMKDGISVDGVHPSESGYRIMEPLAQAAIDKNQ